MTTEATLPRRGRPPTITEIQPGKFALTIRKRPVRFDRSPRGFRCMTKDVTAPDVAYGQALLSQRFPG